MGPDESDFLRTVLVLGGLIAVVWIGAAIISRMHREVHGGSRTTEDIAADFQAAYERGELSAAEYQQIQESLSRSRRAAAPPPRGVPGPSPPPGPDEPVPTPPEPERPDAPPAEPTREP